MFLYQKFQNEIRSSHYTFTLLMFNKRCTIMFIFLLKTHSVRYLPVSVFNFIMYLAYMMGMIKSLAQLDCVLSILNPKKGGQQYVENKNNMRLFLQNNRALRKKLQCNFQKNINAYRWFSDFKRLIIKHGEDIFWGFYTRCQLFNSFILLYFSPLF